MREVLPGPCPVCQAEIQYLYQTEEIPFFSEILIISTVCPSCGYRLADTQLLRNAEPSRWELRIEYPEDMMVRVIRSTNGAISIPELGVRIDPGPACEGFISNVEGVLVRVDGVLSNLRSWAESDEERERIDSLKESIARIQEGQLPATLVIEDLSGNSAIIADRATVCRIEALAEDPDEER
ncbi:zn finger containing protein [hydrocarbon metagenome]|uniref:Zn finger containing protein n=1 Tax=hydrocarbon metagenome TaxID=938273 RepID=A0A0W8EAS2_9ZZZZ